MPWKETPVSTNDRKVDSTNGKVVLNEHVCKVIKDLTKEVIKSDAAFLSPIVKRTSSQVERQFEEQVSCIEEQVHLFHN